MGAWISIMVFSTLSGYTRSNKPLPLIVPPSPPPCHCSTYLPIIMDPLIAAGFHNLTCSPLCRLPEELLLDIMERLDLLSIQCLRRVSRLFLRLYSSPIFHSSHEMIKSYLATHDHWDKPKYQLRDVWCKHLAVLLKRDLTDYCQDCQQTRTHPRWTATYVALTKVYLHCSGCQIDHPACLFSKTQRSTPPKARVCIGREGFIQLCQHQIITWEKVIQTCLQLINLNTGLVTVLLNACQHVSHFPAHHRNHPFLTNYQITCPNIAIGGAKNSLISIQLLWHGHLYLPTFGFDNDGYNKIATPSLLCQELKRFRHGTAEFIVPEIYPGRRLEMNCFDPNRCSCLHYAGVEQLPKGWELIPSQELELRARSKISLHHRELDQLALRRHIGNRLRCLRSLEEAKEESPYEKARIESHEITVQTAGTINQGSSRVVIHAEPCPTENRCLQMRYSRFITIIPKGRRTNYIRWAWFQALDPDSYNLTDDMESFGILWCRHLNCKNYYKYLRKAPFPLKDVNRKCGKYCPSK